MTEKAHLEYAQLCSEAILQDKQSPLWLNALRKQASEALVHCPFPTKHSEEWHYTSLHAFLHNHFDFNPYLQPLDLQGGVFSLSPMAQQTLEKTEQGKQASSQVKNSNTESVDAFSQLENSVYLVFMDGHFSPALSTPLSGLPTGVEIVNLRALASPTFSFIPGDAFTTINQAGLQDGIMIMIGPQPKPFFVHFQHLQTQNHRMAQIRHHIRIQQDAQVILSESFYGKQEKIYWHNGLTVMDLEPYADLQHYTWLNHADSAYHTQMLWVRQQKYSRYQGGVFAQQGAFLRHQIKVDLLQEEASCELIGSYHAKNHQAIAYHTQINHHAPNTKSQQQYQGVLQDKAHAVFQGKITIHPAASWSSAIQNNRTLLLSPRAKIDSQPQLDIFTDEVLQCSHGATIGELDPQALFYLQSRGLSKEQSERLLIHSFMRALYQKVAWRALRKLLDQSLPEI